VATQSIWLARFFSLAAAMLSIDALAAANEYTIDTALTTVSFEVKRLGISRQSGEFSSVVGTVALDAEAGEGAIEITVDTRSIHASSETAENFLRGPNVLNVEQYGQIAYKAVHVVFTGGKPGRIEGTLTLLGVTRPVSLTVVGYTCPHSTATGQQRCTLDATAFFKRSDFGMTRYLAIVSDEVKLDIHGVAGHPVSE